MKKISKLTKNSGNRILTVKEIVRMHKEVMTVFGEPRDLSVALSGLTLSEMFHLRFLLLRCLKIYHTQHPASFSLGLFLDSAGLQDETSGILPSQSSKNGVPRTGTS